MDAGTLMRRIFNNSENRVIAWVRVVITGVLSRIFRGDRTTITEENFLCPS